MNLKKCLRLGIRAKWLATRKDDRGMVWIADGQKAKNERNVAECVARLVRGPEVLPRFTEAVEGECDNTDLNVSVNVEAEEKQAELDANELARIGRETGICQFCGRRLVHPSSLQHGYGPVCAAKHSLPWGEEVANEPALA